ncbi:hypothetical protein D6C90_05014 [Aureobasidium pullulans]|uniref:Uncharacterized protein n=1 Tax=Aureobasidium pullulans TaxID=5580 RepID=A0A4S8XIE3_AURPU|nr:hypothetical protein D6D22_06650 [Aureobasidium pullulans]THZ43499.1 hypothetical protein D6C90_05014 [Aureobasidium pullulans]CAC9888824.1 unnamed protein product [Aureobasidium pullulans]
MNKKSSISTNHNDKTPRSYPHQTSQDSSRNTAVTPVNEEAQPDTAMSTTISSICTVLGGVVLGALAVLAFTFGGDAVRSEMINDAAAALVGGSNSTTPEESSEVALALPIAQSSSSAQTLPYTVMGAQTATAPPFSGRRQSVVRESVEREVTETTDIVEGVVKKVVSHTMECMARNVGNTVWHSMKNS